MTTYGLTTDTKRLKLMQRLAYHLMISGQARANYAEFLAIKARDPLAVSTARFTMPDLEARLHTGLSEEDYLGYLTQHEARALQILDELNAGSRAPTVVSGSGELVPPIRTVKQSTPIARIVSESEE